MTPEFSRRIMWVRLQGGNMTKAFIGTSDGPAFLDRDELQSAGLYCGCGRADCEAAGMTAEAYASQWALNEAERILAETEPGFLLSGDYRSHSVGPDWAADGKIVGFYVSASDRLRMGAQYTDALALALEGAMGALDELAEAGNAGFFTMEHGRSTFHRYRGIRDRNRATLAAIGGGK